MLFGCGTDLVGEELANRLRGAGGHADQRSGDARGLPLGHEHVGAQPLTLADLARATGYYKSTLLRLIASLERSGLVVRRADQRYSLGPMAFRLGRAFEATFHLKESVLPVLHEIGYRFCRC